VKSSTNLEVFCSLWVRHGKPYSKRHHLWGTKSSLLTYWQQYSILA